MWNIFDCLEVGQTKNKKTHHLLELFNRLKMFLSNLLYKANAQKSF